MKETFSKPSLLLFLPPSFPCSRHSWGGAGVGMEMDGGRACCSGSVFCSPGQLHVCPACPRDTSAHDGGIDVTFDNEFHFCFIGKQFSQVREAVWVLLSRFHGCGRRTFERKPQSSAGRQWPVLREHPFVLSSALSSCCKSTHLTNQLTATKL